MRFILKFILTLLLVVVIAVGGLLGNYYTFGCFFAAFLLCCTAPLGNTLLPYLAMLLYGLGIPISNVSFAVWANDLFGYEGYASAVRSFTVAFALGMLLGSGILGSIWLLLGGL